MAKQLTLDELIEAADRARLPTAKPIMRAIESLAMALGADLAEQARGSLRRSPVRLPRRPHDHVSCENKMATVPRSLVRVRSRRMGRGAAVRRRPNRANETSPAAAETMAMFVARYENRHGEAVTRVFATTTLARDWKNAIGRDNWDAVRDGPPPDEIGDAWFEMQADHGSETFSIEPCTVELSLAAPQGGAP